VIDSFCFLFLPRFFPLSIRISSVSGRCARAAVIVENEGRLSDQQPFCGDAIQLRRRAYENSYA